MKGILFGSFGTTCEEARVRQIDGVAKALEAAFAPCPVVQCYTSDRVRALLHKRGVSTNNVDEGLRILAEQGVDEVVVQPGHLLPAIEFTKLCDRAQEQAHLFKSMRIGEPLLSTDADFARFATMLDERFEVQEGSAYVLMGHGTTQFANCAYAALDYRMKAQGRADIFVGAVEGYPSIETLCTLLARCSFKNVHLAPLMLVAGDHAHHDMAGNQPDSWASQLGRAGFEVHSELVGLGEVGAIQSLYIDHVADAWAR